MKFADRLKPRNTVLLLENGEEYWGWSFGARKKAMGEVVFNTAMAGYQEVLTDPSYWGQMVVMTYPHQGNYGINSDDIESQGGPKVSGFVVFEPSEVPSNFTSEESLPGYLEKNGVPGLYGVDTRGLTLSLRSHGVLRGQILSKAERESFKSVKEAFKEVPQYSEKDLILEVTTKKSYWFESEASQPLKLVVVLDLGVKLNLLRILRKQGFKVLVVPAKTSAEEILAHKPQGVFLSNGPGDPALATYAISTVQKLIGKIPMFGVCMGHQILGLALGGKTFKMKFGHRGVNHPVFNKEKNAVEVSSQNHGFAVDLSSLSSGVCTTHTNLNDGTCAGIEVADKKCFSVQYHPEASPGPHDSEYLFDKFTQIINLS